MTTSFLKCTSNLNDGTNSFRIIRLVVLSAFVSFSTFASPTAFGQESEKASGDTTEAVKKIEAAGGRVYRISAADTSKEISFALSDKTVADAQLEGINTIENVIWLNLAGTDITNAGLKQLAGMPLKKLHLEKTKVSDNALRHVKKLKELEYLNLYDTQVTDDGLKHLSKLKNLRKLYVWKSKVTEDGIKKLNESLPELEIVGELKLVPVVVEKKPEAKKETPKAKEGEKKEADKKKANDKPDAAADDKAKTAADKKAKAKNRKKRANKKKQADSADKKPAAKDDKKPENEKSAEKKKDKLP